MKKYSRVLFYALNIMVAAFAREPSCPVCSRYDYEERILERVLGNELDMKNMLQEMRDTNAKVEAALKTIKEDKNELATAMTKLTKTQDEMKFNLDDAINGAMLNISKAVAEMTSNTSAAITRMEKENKILKGDLKTPTILFRAQLASSITVSDGKDVVFTRVEVNEGQGYDNGTGKFTASVAGLYNFDVHYCSQSKKYVQMEIVHNGKSVQRSTHNGGDAYQGSSLQVYVRMSIGDMFWVRSFSSSYFYQNDAYCDSTFSGVLIHA